MSQNTSCESPSIPRESIEYVPNEDRLEQWEGEGGAMHPPLPRQAPPRGASQLPLKGREP
jgi:hypothetical protein